MHNIHVVVVQAKDGQHAIEQVEFELGDCQCAECYFSVLSAFTKDGRSFSTGRRVNYMADEQFTAVEMNTIFRNRFAGFRDYVSKTGIAKLDPTSSSSLRQFGNAFLGLADCTFDPARFDLFEDSYRDFNFGMLGVTHLGDDDLGAEQWAVVLDVHT